MVKSKSKNKNSLFLGFALGASVPQFIKKNWYIGVFIIIFYYIFLALYYLVVGTIYLIYELVKFLLQRVRVKNISEESNATSSASPVYKVVQASANFTSNKSTKKN